MSRCHCHAAPLLTVTLKDRAVVIKWHLIAPPWGATKDSRDHPQGTDTLGPCPLLLCQAFLQVSKVWGWRKVLESRCALPPQATGLVLHLGSEVSARMFLSHDSDVVRVPKCMGLEFVWSSHICKDFHEHTCPAPCWPPKGHSPAPAGLVYKSRTQTLGRLIRSIKYNSITVIIY